MCVHTYIMTVCSLTVFSNCGPPMSPPNGFISPYTSTIEGAKVIFGCQNYSCQNGIQTLPNELHSTLCNSLGQWEPDPLIFCSSKNIHDINYDCVITNNTGIEEELKWTMSCNSVTVAAVSSVITFLVTSVIILIVGFTCGRYFQIATKSSSQEQIPTTTTNTPHQQVAHNEFEFQEQGLGLTENIAYVPTQLTRESNY